MIRFRIHSPAGSAIYEMPYSEAPIATLGGLPADMLQDAELWIGGYDRTPKAKWVEAFVPALPKVETKKKGKR